MIHIHAALAGENEFTASLDEGFQFGFDGIIQQHIVRQDQRFVFAPIHFGIHHIEGDMGFEKDAGGAGIAGQFPFGRMAVRRDLAEDRHGGAGFYVIAPGFLLPDFPVSLPDDLVSSFIQFRAGMELVADAALGAVGDHGGTFVTQSFRRLETAELAPGRMEFPGHAEKFFAQIPHIRR